MNKRRLSQASLLRLPICFFPGREKAKWFRLRICFFRGQERAKWFRLRICFFPTREKAKWFRLPICFFPGREKAKRPDFQFAFSRPGQKQNGSDCLETSSACGTRVHNLLLMGPPPYPLGYSSLKIMLFFQALQKKTGCPICFSGSNFQFAFSRAGPRKSKRLRLPICFFPAGREKAKWLKQRHDLTRRAADGHFRLCLSLSLSLSLSLYLCSLLSRECTKMNHNLPRTPAP